MRTSLRTIPPPESFSRQATSVISLGQVRSGPRTTNEYVDSPRAQPPLPLKPHLSPLTLGGSTSPGVAQRVILPSRGSGGGGGGGGCGGGGGGGSSRPVLSTTAVVSQQPLSKSPPVNLKKEALVVPDGNSGSRNGGGGGQTEVGGGGSFGTVAPGHGDGILCEHCGKCRCAACTEPHSLPSHWCCKDKCEVSPDKLLDVCTCFCCIKGIFYHTGSEEENESYENPCGCCSTPHCCRRWTVMSMMALCLPCLWMYWPARAGLAACTAGYNRCRHRGCQCHSHTDKGLGLSGGGGGGGGGGGIGGGNSKHSQTRRLLIESDSSSA